MWIGAIYRSAHAWDNAKSSILMWLLSDAVRGSPKKDDSKKLVGPLLHCNRSTDRRMGVGGGGVKDTIKGDKE